MSLLLLVGHDAEVKAWVEQRLGETFGEARAIGVLRDGYAVAGVVYNNFRPMKHGNDVMMSIAATSPAWATRGILRALFRYPFDQLGCARVTAMTRRGNKHAREFLGRLGFKLEGAHPRGHDGREAAMSYGMLREQCRWL